MTRQQSQHQAPAPATHAVVPFAERETEYIPFMSKEPIRLSIGIIKNYICVPTKSGKVCDDRQAANFLMLCKTRLLNPFEGDAYLIGYDGKEGPTFSLITAHQAFLKRAEVHNEYDGMESGVIVQTKNGEIIDRKGDFFLDGETVLGGWAIVHFKTRTHPMEKRLKLATFNTGYSRWAKDPAGMIVKCAEADALRSAFPTSLGGMYLEEELRQDDTPKHVVDLSSPPVGPARIRTNGKTPELTAPAADSTPTNPAGNHPEAAAPTVQGSSDQDVTGANEDAAYVTEALQQDLTDDDLGKLRDFIEEGGRRHGDGWAHGLRQALERRMNVQQPAPAAPAASAGRKKPF